MQRNSVGNRPEEVKGNFTRPARDRLSRTRTREDGVRYEQIVLPMQQGRSWKVTTSHDCRDTFDFIWKNGRVGFCQEAEIGSRSITTFEPFFIWFADQNRALERSGPVCPGGVVVWMGYDDCLQSAEVVDL